MLKERIITAIILIPIFLVLLFYLSEIAFLIVTGLVALWGAWEWSCLMQLTKKSARLTYVIFMAIIFYGALFVPSIFILIFAFLFWILATVLIVLYPRGREWWGSGFIWRGIMGIIVLMPCWAAINTIRDQRGGIYGLLFLFLLIWGADSAAYFVGKKWGKTKLAAEVSPGKSVQGVIGALIFTIVISTFILWILKNATGNFTLGRVSFFNDSDLFHYR